MGFKKISFTAETDDANEVIYRKLHEYFDGKIVRKDLTKAYDTAFLDRMHCYIPGWEIPKYRPESFTNDYGFITDYLAEFMREMRKEPFGDVCDRFFRFGNNLNQRDVIAVRK